jgi:predicted DNA-binding transcriptional regulator YafY
VEGEVSWTRRTPIVGNSATDRERGDRFVRLLQMVELLRQQSMSIVELADEFEVTQRTVIRDLIVLERAGAYVQLRRSRRGIGPYRYQADSAEASR